MLNAPVIKPVDWLHGSIIGKLSSGAFQWYMTCLYTRPKAFKACKAYKAYKPYTAGKLLNWAFQ